MSKLYLPTHGDGEVGKPYEDAILKHLEKQRTMSIRAWLTFHEGQLSSGIYVDARSWLGETKNDEVARLLAAAIVEGCKNHEGMLIRGVTIEFL
jgi:hypothetical protein